MLVVLVVNSPMPTGTVTSYFISSTEREKSEAQFFRLFLFLFLCSQTSFFFCNHMRIIYSFLYIKLSLKIYHLTARARERERA